jgi:hypothetical protein
MIDRLSTKATDAELEASNAAAKRNTGMWVVWYVVAITTFTSLAGPLFRLSVRVWGRPHVIGFMADFLRVMLVFSVVMIAVALWRVYAKHGRSRA